MPTDYVITFADETKLSFVIKPYTANGPEDPGQPSTTPLHPQAVSANTPLILFGKGMPEYGEAMAKNVVRLLENFANDDEPAYALEGQLWYNNSTKLLYVCEDPAAVLFTDRWKEVVINGLSGDLDMNGNSIVNVADPVNPQDAMTLAYADAAYVFKAGDTMTGVLELAAGTAALPSLAFASDATKGIYDSGAGEFSFAIAGAQKVRVDASGLTTFSGYATGTTGMALWNTGDTTTGISFPVAGTMQLFANNVPFATFTATGIDINTNVDMNGFKLTNHLDPVNPQDVATKAYVDSLGGGGADGTLSSGSYNDDTGELTLSSTVGGPVTVTGLAPFAHMMVPLIAGLTGNTYSNTTVDNISSTAQLFAGMSVTGPGIPSDAHIVSVDSATAITISQPADSTLVGIPLTFAAHCAMQVSVNANPTGNLTESRLRDATLTNSTYPTTTLDQALGIFDRDIFNLRLQNSRYVVVPASIAVVGVDATLDAWSVTGDYTDQFVAGVLFEVSGDTGGNNGTYTCVSSRYSGGQTKIYVEENITIGAGDGTIELYTYKLPFAYPPERSKLFVSANGIKQYASERGYASVDIQPTDPQAPPVYGLGSDTGLAVGAYSFNVAIDGGAPQAINITVSSTPYLYNDLVNDINVQFPGTAGYQEVLFTAEKTGASATGLANNATVYTAIVVVDGTTVKNIAVTGSAAQTFTTLLAEINTDLGVDATASLEGGNIRITSATTGLSSKILIVNGVTNPLFSTLTNYSAIDRYKYGLANALCLLEATPNVYNEMVPVFKFYSRTVGTNSQIAITDVDLFSNLTEAPTPYNPGAIATDLAYEEDVITATADSRILSDRVTFTTLPTIGSTIEFIVMR